MDGVLHHPAYRERFAENLKRELPRIPLVGGCHSEERSDEESAVGQMAEKRILRSAQNDSVAFGAFSRVGKELAELHVNYETIEPYPLQWMENRSVPLSFRVEDKMRLSKDKTSVKVDDSLTLAGIPPEAFQYRLGNRGWRIHPCLWDVCEPQIWSPAMKDG